MNRTSEKLERLFWIFFFINPFLDILSGIYTTVFVKYLQSDPPLPITPSLAVRLVFLVFMVFYLFFNRHWKDIGALFLVGVSWVLTVVGEYLSGLEVSYFTDAQYITRFLYNIVLLFVLVRMFRNMRLSRDQLLTKLNYLISYTLVVYSLAILIPYVLGVGNSTYADRIGYRGSMGFFTAGNDITAVFQLLTPIALATFMLADHTGFTRGAKIKNAFPPAAALLSLCIIGTKTAFIAAGGGVIGLAIYAVVLAVKGQRREITRLLWVLLFTGVLAIVTAIPTTLFADIAESLDATNILFENEGAESALFSGRLIKLADAWHQYRAGGILTCLFGIGRGTQEVIIEMDLCEVLFYYGVVGFVAMTWVYVKLAVQFFQGLARSFDLRGWAAMLAIGMCFGYLVIAGHILFSVTAGAYFMFTIVYSRILFSRDEHDILFWKEA